jgi:hypothetical protein
MMTMRSRAAKAAPRTHRATVATNQIDNVVTAVGFCSATYIQRFETGANK